MLRFSASPVVLAVVAHVLIWAVTPALLIGNLHQDTLEAAYWGSGAPLSLARHPPLLSLMIQTVLGLHHAPIFLLLLMSQLGMAVAAFYVWRAARLYGGPQAAALAVMLFVTSLPASFFAVQVNHNSMLAPFWAATLYYALAYFERTRGRDALLLGLSAGLGLLVKYELALLLACLFALCLLRYRAVLRRPMTYVAALVCAAILAPHVADALRHGGHAAAYALGGHEMDETGLVHSVANICVGQILLFAPNLIVVAWAARGRIAGSDKKALVGAVLAFGPSLALIAGVVVTDQVAQPLWVLPFASSCAVGLALLFDGAAPEVEATARRMALGSSGLLVAFIAYLFLADVVGASIGRPLTFYAADSRKLGEAVARLWETRANGPFCVVIADPVLAASTVLWLRRALYVDFDHAEWSGPQNVRRCGRSGGIAILTHTSEDALILKAFPALRTAPRRSLAVPAAFGFSGQVWRVDLVFLAPA
ncbi:4-amino-4-deoxy-L-arabinose transferase-like glycosyltransferase [Rhodoblastus acidophilus]|uniref:glycosyltransferase family 39 protein n=1 Tax=Rhodoblastus acidophilus TaxID=1074 RepID=UPI0022250447|nr:glycosyltransferase family 39 protein [Rhodoblastus acidophilus]MCW2285024.1 4-amino-4-deoxy-L-arabinose transferase-like glycosyltransferase [Rhodoblastus acidophilus]MCW2333912.1 4-amino-4-deoxy-L-arabinose transferase-like glycosyltransferase [Rhodoblastus acidophilus]